MKTKALSFAVAAAAVSVCLGAERIIQIEEFDHLANRTAAFNPGAALNETRCGVTCLAFNTEKDGDFHTRHFAFADSPKEKEWSLYFRFRSLGADPRAFGFRLYFGDKAKPETKLLVVSERGSHFEGEAKPAAPKEGDAGFLFGGGEAGFGAWNRAAITVRGNQATFWVYRGGKLVEEAHATLPAKPLVGWNLTTVGGKAHLSFDRVVLVDGVARPYERGDLTEVIRALASAGAARPPYLGEGAGSVLEAGKAFSAELKDKELDIRFKSAFAKGASVAFAFDLGGEKPETVSFRMENHGGETSYRVFEGGKFADKKRDVVVTNGLLKVVTYKERGFYAVPPIESQLAYETPEIAEIAAARDVFPRPNERVWTLTLRPDGAGACRLLLEGQLLRTMKMPKTSVSVTLSGAAAEASARVADYVVKGAETWPLALPKDGFRLERVRENLGSYALECNEYLSRNAFRWMPSSCLWNVPRKQWNRAKVTCKIDPSAPKEQVPVVTARLTHFVGGQGRSEAMVDVTVDLSKPDPRVTKKGDLYEIDFGIDVGRIMDLTSMTDGLLHVELPYLHFELTGPLWEKSSYYVDSRRSPAEELRSSVIVLKAELLESPVYLKAVPVRAYSMFYPGETPQAVVTAKPIADGAYAFTATVADDWGKELWKHSEPVGAGLEKTLDLPGKLPFGHYIVTYAMTDAQGAEVQKHVASYGLLPKDDRQAGYESPYISWNWCGAHGTVSKIEDWLPPYRYLGFRRPMMPKDVCETNEPFASLKMTTGQFPFIRVGKKPEDREAAKARMRDLVKRFPHCKEALVFHESGGGPFPKEAFGGKMELTERQKNQQHYFMQMATRTAECWREVDPSVKLVYGNSGESYGLVGFLMRGGYPKELVDKWGEESVGLTMAPEMSTAFTPWIIKKLARDFGYTQKMSAPFEWKNRTERFERSFRGAAALNMRDMLISHALEYDTIPQEIGCEVANSYADTIWDVATFSRWPLAYPSENALALATLTRVLDCAKFERMVPTGSLTGYALEFRGKDGTWVYALWMARGETTAAINWKGGATALGFVPWKPGYRHVNMTGAETETDALEIEVLDEASYLVADKRIESFAFAPKRTFRHENAASLAKNRTVDALAKASDVAVVAGEDVRIDPAFEDAPHRPGAFAVKDAVDDEKGACVEVEHLSQKDCPEIMMEYCLIKIKNPKTIAEPFDTLGIWAKGNSNWGKLAFEITDAEGEVWFTAGMGGVGCYVYDWPAKLSLNYDGWHFIQMPVTAQSDVRIVGPGMNHWTWTRDGNGNGKIDWPVKVTGIGFSQMGRTLDILEMKPSAPTVRLGKIEVR